MGFSSSGCWVILLIKHIILYLDQYKIKQVHLNLSKVFGKIESFLLLFLFIYLEI